MRDLGVISIEKAKEPTLGISHKNVVDTCSLDQRLEVLVGPDRARTRTHGVLDGPRVSQLRFSLLVQHAEDDARIIDCDAKPIASCL